MVATIAIHAEYGYVVLVMCLSWVLLNWLAFQVMKARKKYEMKVSCEEWRGMAQLPSDSVQASSSVSLFFVFRYLSVMSVSLPVDQTMHSPNKHGPVVI